MYSTNSQMFLSHFQYFAWELLIVESGNLFWRWGGVIKFAPVAVPSSLTPVRLNHLQADHVSSFIAPQGTTVM